MPSSQVVKRGLTPASVQVLRIPQRRRFISDLTWKTSLARGEAMAFRSGARACRGRAGQSIKQARFKALIRTGTVL
jgi:hypothetical protein